MTGRRARRTWSKKADPVMPPSEIRTACAPLSRVSSSAYPFHVDQALAPSSSSTMVSLARTSPTSPREIACSRFAPMSLASRSFSSRLRALTQHTARSRLPSATRAAWTWDGSTHASTSSRATAEARAARSGGSQFV